MLDPTGNNGAFSALPCGGGIAYERKTAARKTAWRPPFFEGAAEASVEGRLAVAHTSPSALRRANIDLTNVQLLSPTTKERTQVGWSYIDNRALIKSAARTKAPGEVTG